MSALSRYLEAISPRGDDIPLTPSPNSRATAVTAPSPSPSASHNSHAKRDVVVCGSGGGNTNINNSNSNNAYNVNLRSPSEIRGRKVLVGGEGGAVGAIGIDPSVSNNNFVRSSPPPPPPPGPPPKKAVKRQQQQQQHQYQQQYPRGTGSSSGFGSVKPPENIIINNPGDKSSAADKNEQGEEEKVAKGGSPWSPQEEIQGGSVAKFQQMLWGGGGGTGGAAAVGGAGGVLGGGKGAGGGGAMLLPATPPRHTPGSTSSFPVSRVGSGGGGNSGNPTKNFVNNGIATSTTPASTKGNNSNSTYNTAMTGPSPRYKRNAPPPLENNDRDDETSGLPARRPTTTTATTTTTTTATTSSTPPTSMRKTPKIQLPTPPSRILSSPLRSGSVKNTPIAGGGAGGGGPSNSSSSSALRHRVGNILNLTPLDTSFGRSGDDGNAGGIQSSSLSPSPLLPLNASSTTSGRKLYAANEKGDNSKDTGHNATAASLSSSNGFKGNNVGGGDSGNVDGGKGDAPVPGSSRTNVSPKYHHPRGDKGTTAINALNTQGADDSNVETHDDENSSPPPPVAAGINNDDGISTFTAFKRPNVKVGLVFTRHSAQHPDVAVISRVMPESIFRRHHLLSPSGGGGGVTTLEGVEVIAVNGTPVRDPRHAAELVARAVEEVRLTVKRGVCTGGSGLSNHDSLPGTNPCGGDGSENATTEGDAVENVRHDNTGKESDPRERMARTLALIDASSLSQREKSMGSEESKLSAMMEEGGENLSALERRDEKCDSSIVFIEKKKEGEKEEEWSAWTERRDADLGREADLMAVNASKLTVSSRGVGGGRTSSVMSMSTTMTMPKSAEIAERRRKVAQAMLLSEELVEDSITGVNEDNVVINKEYDNGNACNGWKRNEIMESAVSKSRRLSTDPIQLNRSNDDDDVEETFTYAASSGGDGYGSSRARSTAGFSTVSSPSTAVSVAASTAHSGVSGTPSNVSSASAADRRRRAALEMYHSSEMVPDNVDDVRLGTIDAFGPPLTPKDNATHALDNDKVLTLSSWMKAKPLSDVGRVTSFGSATSKARTDVTTSSVATARMGGGGIRLKLSPIVGSGSGGKSPSSNTISSGVVALASAAHANNTATTCSTTSSPLDGFNSGSIGDTQGGSPTNAPMRIESPAAQRRRERAAHRRLIGAGDRGGDSPLEDGTQKMGVGDWPKIPVPASPVEKVTASNSIQTPPPFAPQKTPTSADIAQRRLKVAQAMIQSDALVNDHVGGTPDPFELSKSSEECITVASGAKSGVGSNGSPGSPRSNRSAMGFSKIKSGSRLRGGQSLTTGDGQKTRYSQVQEDVPKKKKSSIFGVARLIRKASSKKSKSSIKSASLVEDTNLFEVGDSPIAVSTRCASPMSNTSPSTAAAAAIIEEKRESDTLPTPPSLIASDPFSNLTPAMHGNDGWEGSDFFKENPFAPSPFESDLASGDNDGNDVFGFPTTTISDGVMGNRPSTKAPLDADCVASNTFFDLDVNLSNTWGDPTSILPVNITPRRDNAAHRFNDHQHGNVDANSYDESEMSEVTDPTFASSSIKQNTAARLEAKGGDTSRKDENAKTKGKNVVDNSDSSIKENHSRQSRQNHSSISVSRAIEKRRALKGNVVVDPPLASLDTIESSEHEREDNNTPMTIFPVAKSRILSKYAKSGKVRRGAVHSSSVGNDKIEPQSSDRSIGSVGSMSQNSRTGKLRQELEISAKMLKTPLSADPKPARKGGATATSAAASAIALAAVPSMKGGASPHQQRINPAATYSRKSPKRLSTSSTAGNTSSVISSSSPACSPAKKYSSPNRKKKVSPSVVENPAYYSMESRLGQIKDPIQRAGVKLLWAAAIPIQTQARRFMARQVAIRRMCAVLTVQAFVRRWLAERDLEIAIWSAIQIQASFRGWFARDSLEDNHYCATQIQRVARGFLATMHVFEDLYCITVVQSVVRMHLAINCAVDRLSSIIAIQSWWRGIRTRELIEKMDYSAVAIQTQWRRYLAQMSYQFDIIDIIIVQSVARRWNDRRTLATVRLQCFARVVIAKKKFQDKKTMHALFTRHISATKIQAWWRRYTAQVDMLVYIVNVILIQSLWRRRNAVRLYQPLLNRMKLARERKRKNSAISIQSAWRGFVVYSTYLIKRYENKAAVTIQATWRGYWQATSYSVLYCAIVKVQALVRGAQERSWLVFQNKCATIIQASSRRLMVRKDNHTECMISILIAAAASSLRMRNAARRLQFWWMDEMRKRREKHAALVIERFFIYIKKEVEKEVAALKKKKKERRQRHKMKQSDDYILERAWLGVADDAIVPVVQTALLSQRTAASRHPPVNSGTGDKLRNKYSRFRARGVIQSFEDDVQSDVSGLTDLDFGYRNNGTTRSRQKKSQIELEEDVSLEEALRNS